MADSSAPQRNVVVAIDGSKHADYALDFYVKHIRKNNDQVILAYVPELNNLLQSTSWEPSAYKFERTVLESALQAEEQRIHEDLEKFAAKLKEYKMGGKVRSFVAKNAGEGIVMAIEEENADLAVVGCRGMGKIRRTFMGSVSDYVVHHSHVPVLVVRHDDDKHHKDKHHDKHNDSHKEDKHKEGKHKEEKHKDDKHKEDKHKEDTHKDDKHKDDKHKDAKKDDKHQKHKD